jgi:hypothetical protein
VKSAALSLLLLAGCASGPPVVRLDAAGYVRSYVAERDAFRDRTAPARRRCEAVVAVRTAPFTGVPVPTPPPANLDALQRKCEALRDELARWAERDTAVLQAILTRETINAETLNAVWPIVEKILVLAVDVLL